jgi:hypothetical protein
MVGDWQCLLWRVFQHKGVPLHLCCRSDPGKKGPFVVRLKIPPDLNVPAHQHPTEEVVTVISGDFRFGMGDKLDASKAEKLGPRGVIFSGELWPKPELT